MRSRNFVLWMVVVAIIGFLAWYFLRPKVHIPDKTVVALVSTKADAPKAITPPQIAQPLASPVQAKPEAAKPTTAMDAPANADPRADLNTAIAEIIRLYEANDNLTYVREFFTPDDLNRVKSTMNMSIEAWVQMSEQYEDAAQVREDTLTIWRSTQGQTPTMSGDGNRATYETVTADGSHKKAALKKHDGLWYVDYIEP